MKWQDWFQTDLSLWYSTQSKLNNLHRREYACSNQNALSYFAPMNIQKNMTLNALTTLLFTCAISVGGRADILRE